MIAVAVSTIRKHLDQYRYVKDVTFTSDTLVQVSELAGHQGEVAGLGSAIVDFSSDSVSQLIIRPNDHHFFVNLYICIFLYFASIYFLVTKRIGELLFAR